MATWEVPQEFPSVFNNALEFLFFLVLPAATCSHSATPPMFPLESKKEIHNWVCGDSIKKKGGMEAVEDIFSLAGLLALCHLFIFNA